MKICLIWQPGGLGDILYTLKIGSFYSSNGYRVIWPVVPIYANLSKYIDINGIEFFDINSDFPYKNEYKNFDNFNMTECIDTKDILYLPLDQAFHSTAAKKIYKSLGHECSNMLGKYAMCDIDYQGWQSCFEINRNNEKEEELFKRLGSPNNIHLINNVFGTPPRWNVHLNKRIETPSNMSRVVMKKINGFSIFDWCGILERSQKIDTVATSTVFLFEKLKLSCCPTVHSRNKTQNSATGDFVLMKKIYSKEYIYEV